jgi:DNA-binding HxlR family transcriptional regulator
MADYGNYCPVSLGSEVLADRWTPLIVRELVLGSTRFNDIARGLPGISRSLLIQRLRHLERKGVLERWPSPAGRGSEYRLTPAGKDLEPVLMALGQWAVEWLYDDLEFESVDAITLTWWMHRRIDAGALPDRRVVMELEHTAPEPVTVWLVLDRGDASVCIQPPGFDVDLLLRASTPALAQLFNGLDSWRHAIGTGSIELAGPPALCRQVPRWFLGSPFAPTVATRARRATQDRPLSSSRSSRSA